MSDLCMCAGTIVREARTLAGTGVPADDIAPLLLALSCRTEDLYTALAGHLHAVAAFGAADRVSVRAGQAISLALDSARATPVRPVALTRT